MSLLLPRPCSARIFNGRPVRLQRREHGLGRFWGELALRQQIVDLAADRAPEQRERFVRFSFFFLLLRFFLFGCRRRLSRGFVGRAARPLRNAQQRVEGLVGVAVLTVEQRRTCGMYDGRSEGEGGTP